MAELPPQLDLQDDPDLHSFFSSSSSGMLVVGPPGGTVLRANGAFCDMLRLDSSDVVGRLVRELPWKNDARFATAIEAMVNGSAERFDGEVEVHRGARGAGRLAIAASAYGSGPNRRASAIAQDVTDRADPAVELRVLHARAMDQLDAARKEGKALEAALDTAQKQKHDFLAMLSHELRNPLAPIRNATRIARTPTATPDQLQWSLAVIERQVQHMARLVDDLLDVSRITRGLLRLQPERTKLNDAIAAAVELARPLIDARRHRLRLEVPPEPLWIDGDPVRLAQIFGNLLTNAAKYTHFQGEIDICVAREGQALVTTIRDNGEGISAELLPQVFTMFSQSSPGGRREGGLGIGLALVEGLVQLHRGTVEASSAGPGRGSEFTVRLPMAAPTQRTGNGEMQANIPTGSHGLRILVADDNIDAAESLAMLLRLQGHDVRVAHDGMGAIREADAFRPHVALVDIGMPIMNGHDVARWIRSQGWGGTMRVVALTGWNQPMDRVQTSLSGFDKHLAKPVSMQDLTACFSDVNREDAPERV